jgi:4-carboxymuconolactone decarboxylase
MRKCILFLLLAGYWPAWAQLEPRQEAIVRIASLTGAGNLPELEVALGQGLDHGLTVNEIKEILVHTYAYCGFPRSIRGLQTFMAVVDGRKAKGIQDTLGQEAVSPEDDKYRRGQNNLSKLNGVPPSDKLQGYGAFAPVMDKFLKEHLFADLFEREVLTFTERELVTIAVIASIGKAEPMLESHLRICRRLGLSEAQLSQVGTVLRSTLGKSLARSYTAVRTSSLSPPSR